MIQPLLPVSTRRLTFRRIDQSDAKFILCLYNTTGFKKYIGDKNLRNIEDAQAFIVNNLLPLYQKRGMGLYLVMTKNNYIKIGICGLIDRDTLEHIDLGYGYLPQYQGSGYAQEAAKSTLNLAKNTLNLDKVVAICTSNNSKSIALLKALDFKFDQVQEQLTNEIDLLLYSVNL